MGATSVTGVSGAGSVYGSQKGSGDDIRCRSLNWT